MMGFYLGGGGVKLITKQILANDIARAWLEQYPKSEYKGTDKWVIYENLVKLGDNPSVDDVNKTIGNNSWTRIDCCSCDKNDIHSAASMNIYDNSAYVCIDCINSAKSLF